MIPTVLTRPNPTLFNCCADHAPPAVGQYDAFEVHPVAELLDECGEGYCEQVSEDHEAQFWSVYGHLPEGGVECITDVSTRRLAETAADLFSRHLIAR